MLLAKEHWNKRFGAEDYAYGKEPNTFIKEKGPLLPKGKVLAVAEGEGRNAVYLATLKHDVSTWDFSSEGLKKTEQLAEEKGVHVETNLVDLNEAAWEKEAWDHIVLVFGHFETELRESTLKNIEKAIRPGGSFLCEVYSPDQLNYRTGGPRMETMLYRPEEFLTTFHGWDIKHFFLGEVEREEGELHQGKSHVIQFYGIKR